MISYDFCEIVNAAIISKTPYIIVEGIDDVQLYEKIADSAGVACEVYCAEMINGFSGGSRGVLEVLGAIDSLQMPEGKSAEQFILGIIDRDAKYYRKEINNTLTAFVLNFYSIESHFVSKHLIRRSISMTTKISSSDHVDVDSIYASVEASVFDTYYFSLDALKNAIYPDYRSIVSFSENIGRRKDRNTNTDLLARKNELDEFASEFNLTPNIDSLRRFVKGKWLLTAYAEGLLREISNLSSKCKSNEVFRCRMCEINYNGPCLFGIKNGFNNNTLYNVLMEFVEIPDFDYIREKFKSIKYSSMR